MGSSKDTIAISFGDDTFMAAHIRGTGRSAKVTHIKSEKFPGVSGADLSKLVHSSLRGFNPKGSTIILVAPAGVTTTKNIEIPSTNAEEIHSIVNLQAGRHTPYSRDEIQVGYVNIGTYKGNYSKVLLVIANRNTLNSQIEVLSKAGLKVKRVIFSPETTAGLYNQSLSLSSLPAPTGIIDIGQASTNFIIAVRGKPITTRNIPVGNEQLKQDSGNQAKLIDEIVKTIESYKTEDIDQLPANYLLTVNDEITQGLQPALKAKVPGEIQIAPYVDGIKASSAVLREIAHNPNVSFLDVISAGAYASSTDVNLLPEEVQLRKSVEDQGREFTKMAALAMLSVIIAVSALGLRIFFKHSYLSKLRQDYSAAHQEVLELERLATKTKIIRGHLQSRMVSLEVINELYNNLPNEIYLTSILMDEAGNVSIQGVSEIASLVFNLGTSLKESKVFKSVDIKSTTAKKDRGKDVSAFEIALSLTAAPKAQEPAAEEAAGEAALPEGE